MSGQPVFRFAPSPNGHLHLGHALSAILNFDAAQVCGGRFLLRIEDIDRGRTREAFVSSIAEDLDWLGLRWEQPVRRQSQHFADYAASLATLRQRGLIYACQCTRSDIARAVAGREADAPWPRDPDGAPVYPGTCRGKRVEGGAVAWRLDMARAIEDICEPLNWQEVGGGNIQIVQADPTAWGDAVLARKDVPTSYHLAVVHDDALQGITHVIRGKDLYAATAIHRVLQTLLRLPAPVYSHHRLVCDEQGQKLSKSAGSPALRDLRTRGVTAAEIRKRLGLLNDGFGSAD